jgi:hypothetical protein
MMNFTIDFVNEENTRLHAEFAKKYKKSKDRYANSQEHWRIGETIRGLYVMEKWQREGANGNPVAVLRFYSLAEDVFPTFVSTYLSHLNESNGAVAKIERRKDKYGTFEKWTEEHKGEEYTTDQLVEVAGFSYQTTLKYVSESPLFIKVKKGLWRISDPKHEE